jgi:DNA-nicking Smr family endonuclease
MMMIATLLDAKTRRVFALHNCDIKRDSKGAVFVLRERQVKEE